MKILVTGANGFVGQVLTGRLSEAGHEIVAAVGPGGEVAKGKQKTESVELDLTKPESVAEVGQRFYDAVIHLAGIASGADARSNPRATWEVNTVGTALLCENLASGRESVGSDPVVLVVSTSEVYGIGSAKPRKEEDDVLPTSIYAASKLGAEIASLEVHRRTGLKVIIARAFPHSGAGQDSRFVLPVFASRILTAKATGAERVPVGNLAVTRELLHVTDVVDAYVRLVVSGAAGEVYNVASGKGVTLSELFQMIARNVGYEPVPELDPELLRDGEIAHLVGDGTKLKAATGWELSILPEQIVSEVVDAQIECAKLGERP